MKIFRNWLFLFPLIVFSGSTLGSAISEQQIKHIFPKATSIGDTLAEYPVQPIYQLQELLGYVFQTNDLVDFPGFSGDKINLLIGIDTGGNIKGIQILSHHEPIFLHGLGPEPLDRFIEQYIGKNVSNRIIVDKAANDTNLDDKTVHVDGVTKATVSVIVVNDTILLSSLQVARNMLEGFTVAPLATPKDDFQSLSWQQLLDRGYVRKWTLTRQQFEQELNAQLEDFPADTFAVEEGDEFTIYYAYLNAPSIGINLLGEAEYQRLMTGLKPNEQAFAVMSEGFFHYLEDDFKPGTVADQINLEQGNLPLAMRDLNFYSFTEPSLASGAPITDDLQLFVVNTQSGFNPSLDMQLSLNLTVAKNHLVQQQARFQDDYALPSSLFDIAEAVEVEPPTPPWVRIWESRIGVISVLIASLILVTVIFIYQHKLSANQKLFRYVRWSFMFFTLFFIGWYAQGQLSVVNIFPIIQSLMNGFEIQMYLMDPVLFILWIYVFISLFIVGRGIFCGWLCPFGALQEMLGWVAKKLRIRQKKVPYWLHSKLWWVKYGILIGLVFTSIYSIRTAEVLSEVEPFKTAITLQFYRYWPFVVYSVVLLAAGLFINKFYCRYVCPLGAGLAILGYFHMGEWLTRRKDCGSPCTLCHHKCDIKAITPKGEINYNECVQCLECIVYYNNDDLCPPLKKNKRKNRGKAIDVSQQPA
ncbi:4Fe-4S binding protein [Aliiglaciecola sp. 3_MG-2023]|uniref:NosR/NirI family protein n=1 Tax=Aliiglaciecola sp. 3_MG-2023 TaxID=3062644 RepID=UPI0026E46EFA|nr:NosR/NirI family protein [Aliiglaciecola sp. 3_MG-2023]MDO6694582.1 4Fe-4S binding protein [Aliiglaciecola sp. 3_MG-2023]